MVRRLKSEVLTQLPRKRRQQVMLDLEPDAKKQLAGLQKQVGAAGGAGERRGGIQCLARVGDGSGCAGSSRAGCMSSLRSALSGVCCPCFHQGVHAASVKSEWRPSPKPEQCSWRLCGR